MRKFWILDVFAESPYAGNQLAVVQLDAPLATDQMLALTREFGFSETTFVSPRADADGSWPTRIFTPDHEMPFAGHPSLGTASVIRECLGGTGPSVVLALKAGKVPVRFDESGVAWLKPPQPTFGKRWSAAALARLLDISESDIDTEFPIEDVSTGMPFTFVPLRTADAVARARFRDDQRRDGEPDAVFLFCRETVSRDNHLHARMFAPGHGVAEDAATGSANACLACYLLRHPLLGPAPLDARVEQGYEMKRPSLIRLRARGTAESPEIEVGGRVRSVAEGSLV
jgi:trans-2,3-dihydro-3-hydroxyanthranilate isomerase